MIIEHARNAQYLSNTYLVCDRDGGSAVVIDAGGPLEPVFAAADRLSVSPSMVLLTHHHHDHVSEVPGLAARWPGVPVLISPLEREEVRASTGTVDAGERLAVGELVIRPLGTPGHTRGMLSFLIEHDGSAAVFTGDTLFRDSVGGVRAPGHTTYQALKDSIMGTLMELDSSTEVHPGHSEPSTIAREWEHNPFIRIWRGLDREGARPCVALGEPATLILLGPDYDGGHKAWVRWPDGSDDIVPGSRVEIAD
ncbi:MAG TPA: MBL fold metallo-hydrolase [Solirubrobacteraceae bacterium]|jgi:glyoxylase-like metal-dependent hydrolase (beta-lactamase superfamily II)